VFVQLPQPLVVLSPDGHVVDCNQAARERLGTHARQTVEAAFPGRIAARVLHQIGNRNGKAQTVWLSDESSTTGYDMRVTPLMVQRGQAGGYLVSFHHVTERERTTQALRRAQDAAAEAERMRQTFLNTVQHEVRTPLSGIRALSSMVTQADNPDERRELGALLEQSGARLETLLVDVLAYTRPPRKPRASPPRPSKSAQSWSSWPRRTPAVRPA
jgi:signal transduction histidine kinase